jgi:PAS domain S-box-containing protein
MPAAFATPLPTYSHALDSAARLADILMSVMDAVLTVDETQRILFYNPAAERIFGWPAADMMGQPLSQLIPERFHTAHTVHIARFGATGATSRRMSGSALVYGRRANGEEFPIDASISHLETAEGKLFTVIVRDLTARMQAQQEHAQLSALLDSAMDAIISLDASHHIVLYNQAAEKMFDRSAAEMIGQSLDQLIPLRFRTAHTGHLRHFERTGNTSRRMGDTTVLYALRASGEEFPIEASISQLDTSNGKLLTVILRDVSERMRAKEEFDSFAAEAHAILEREKSRIARELHDDLAQSLTALKMDINWVRNRHQGGSAEVSTKLDDMLTLMDATVAATRRIAADLRPLLLDDLGLIPAIEWLAQNFTQRSGVTCNVVANEDMDLAEPYATAAFRMVQEALANVAKHAKAAHVEVHVKRTGDGLSLSIQDDGSGFSEDAPRKPNSLGLMGLRERAHLLKGFVKITSQPGAGTRVDIRFPVRP